MAAERSFSDAELLDALPRVRSFALRLTRCPDAAEDLLHDTVERALDRQDQYRPGTNLRAWLQMIALSICVNGRRKRNRYWVDQLPEEFDIPVAARTETIVFAGEVMAAVDLLTPVQRDALLLAVAGATLQEASLVLGAAVATVKTRQHRARLSLERAIA